jgi:hypothetical protein
MQKRLSARLAVVSVSVLLSLSALAQINQVNQTVPQPASGQALQLSLNLTGRPVHIMPLPEKLKALGAVGHNGGTPPLLYHGGPVMLNPKVYAIYWIPAQLQDGSATSLTTAYQTVQSNMLKEYWGHGIATMNTQYYQGSGSAKKYIKSNGTFGAAFVDTNAYPGQNCSDPAGISNPSNCITDTDIQNEIKRVMTLKGWTGGLNKMFLMFTSSNEGSCYSTGVCSYNYYCAYHSSFVNGVGQDVIYSNEPYGDTLHCQIPGASSPNNNAVADTAATAASHELSEAITDPLGTAWFDSSGFENGDECAYYYGFTGYNNGTSTAANELWDGKPFLLQTEYSNVLQNFYISDPNFTGCFNAGPDL